MTPTKEQRGIIDQATTGSSLAIRAFAGSAKTTTCLMVAEALDNNALYVAFNKSIAVEASSKFPPSVTCKTCHSLAYAAIMTREYKSKLQGWLQASDVVSIGKLSFEKKLEVVTLTTAYCQSAYESITTFAIEKADDLDIKEVDLDILSSYWKDLINPKSKAKISHDIYLKMFQLTQPMLGYDTIYLDEAQDSNPVILDIVLRQKNAFKTQLIIVGDDYQAIYAWRGAENALASLGDGFTSLYLTESFRFTQEVADIAEKIISKIGNTRHITGNALYTTPFKTSATIVRTNITLVQEILDAEEVGKKVKVLADLKSLYPKLYHVEAILLGEVAKRPTKEFSQYKTKEALEIASEELPELRRIINLVKLLWARGGVEENIVKIKKASCPDATHTITTAHKSKGLEWCEVTLTEDMFYPKGKETNQHCLENNQTGQLLYVAITRGKFRVNLPSRVLELLED